MVGHQPPGRSTPGVPLRLCMAISASAVALLSLIPLPASAQQDLAVVEPTSACEALLEVDLTALGG